MTFEANQSGIDKLDKLFEQIAQKLEAVDADLRSRFAGQPVDDIVGPAAEAFQAAGVNLAPEQLRDYATSVSEEKPFTFDPA